MTKLHWTKLKLCSKYSETTIFINKNQISKSFSISYRSHVIAFPSCWKRNTSLFNLQCWETTATFWNLCYNYILIKPALRYVRTFATSDIIWEQLEWLITIMEAIRVVVGICLYNHRVITRVIVGAALSTLPNVYSNVRVCGIGLPPIYWDANLTQGR